MYGPFFEVEMWKSALRCGAKHISKPKYTKYQMYGPLLEVEMSKKCTPLWGEAHFQVKSVKNCRPRTTFGSWDVEKVHAVVAPSTFASQNVQSTSASDDFWKLRCRKSARRCDAKHISKSKCTKHTNVGPLLEVEMSKKCTLLRGKAHLQVKMYKAPQLRNTFRSCDVEKVHAVVGRSAFSSQKFKKLTATDHFWKLRCRKSARRCGASTFPSQHMQNTRCTERFWKLRCRKRACCWGAKHISKSKCTRHHTYGPLLTVQCGFAWQAQGIVNLTKSKQNVRFV